MNNFKPGTAPTTTENEQTITFTKDVAGTGTSIERARKTSRKRNPKRKEKRKIKEQERETAKMVDVVVMEIHRGIGEGEDDGTASTEHTPTTNESSEDASSAAEAQQLADELQQFEDTAREAGREAESQQDDGDNEYGTDTDMPPLVGRQRDDASSDGSSDGSYNYHTDNDNSSIEGSDDEGSNTVPGGQNGHDGCSSDDVPKSIDTSPIVPPWMYSVVEDDYEADCDDDARSTQTRETIVPLRMRGGGGVPVVETVTDEDTEEGIEELDHPLPSQQPIIPTTTKTTPTPQQPKYDPMKGEMPPAIVTPSYIPLWKKNEH